MQLGKAAEKFCKSLFVCEVVFFRNLLLKVKFIWNALKLFF